MAYTNGNLAYQYEEKASKRKAVKKVKKTLPAKEKVVYLFAVLMIVVMAGVVISGYAQLAEYNYSLQKTEKSITSLNQQNEELERRIAELSSPDRITTIAQNELNMSLNEQQIIVISRP